MLLVLLYLRIYLFRIFQSSARPEEQPEYWDKLTVQDKRMHQWFVGKCKYDKSWC